MLISYLSSTLERRRLILVPNEDNVIHIIRSQNPCCLCLQVIHIMYFSLACLLQIRHNERDVVTSLTIVYLTVYSGADPRKHQSSASLDFVRGIRRSPVNSPHRGPVTLKMLPFDGAIMRNILKAGPKMMCQCLSANGRDQLQHSLFLHCVSRRIVRRRRRATPYFFSKSWYLIRVT